MSLSSTLLVMPPPLLKHLMDQTIMHIAFNYLTSANGPPAIYDHACKQHIDVNNCNVFSTLPLIFIDDGLRALSLPAVLLRFSLVVASYDQFQVEWKVGSV